MVAQFAHCISDGDDGDSDGDGDGNGDGDDGDGDGDRDGDDGDKHQYNLYKHTLVKGSQTGCSFWPFYRQVIKYDNTYKMCLTSNLHFYRWFVSNIQLQHYEAQ